MHTSVHDLEALGIHTLALVDLGLADLVALAVFIREDAGVVTPGLAWPQMVPGKVDLVGHGLRRLAACHVSGCRRVLVDKTPERLLFRGGDRRGDSLHVQVVVNPFHA